MAYTTKPPKFAGYWQLGHPPSNLRLAQVRRPRWFTRVLMKALLEITWADGDISQ